MRCTEADGDPKGVGEMSGAIFWVYKGLAWVIFAVVVLQFFLAGLGVFEVNEFGPHAITGLLLVLASLILLIVAIVAAATRSLTWGRVGLAALLFVLMILQAALVIVWRGGAPGVIAALHPVNALLLLIVGYTLARGRRLTQMAEGGPAAEPAGPSRVR